MLQGRKVRSSVCRSQQGGCEAINDTSWEGKHERENLRKKVSWSTGKHFLNFVLVESQYILFRSGVKAPQAILGKCFSLSLALPPSLSFFCFGFGSPLYLPLSDWDSIWGWHGVKNKVLFLPLYYYTLCFCNAHYFCQKKWNRDLQHPVNLLWQICQFKRNRTNKNSSMGAAGAKEVLVHAALIECHHRVAGRGSHRTVKITQCFV